MKSKYNKRPILSAIFLSAGILGSCNGSSEPVLENKIQQNKNTSVDTPQKNVEPEKSKSSSETLELLPIRSISNFKSKDYVWFAPKDILESQKNPSAKTPPYIAYLGDDWYACSIGKESVSLLDKNETQIKSDALKQLSFNESQNALITKESIGIQNPKSDVTISYIPMISFNNIILVGNFKDESGSKISFNGINVQGLPNANSYIVGLFDGPDGKLSYLLITSDKKVKTYSEDGHQYHFYILERNANIWNLHQVDWENGESPNEWELYASEEFNHSPSKGKLLYQLTLD